MKFVKSTEEYFANWKGLIDAIIYVWQDDSTPWYVRLLGIVFYTPIGALNCLVGLYPDDEDE